jgi:WD40 repeat protein
LSTPIISRDGRFAEFRGYDFFLHFFDIPQSNAEWKLPSDRSYFSDVVFSREGRIGDFQASEGRLYLRDIRSGKEVRRLQVPGGTRTVALSPDENYVALGRVKIEMLSHETPSFRVSSSIQVVDFISGKVMSRIDDAPEANTLSISSGNHFLAVGTLINGGGIYDLLTGRRIRWLSDRGVFRQMRFSLDSRRLAVTDDSNSFRLFDAKSGSQTWTATLDATVQALAFSPDGAYLAAGSSDNTAWLFAADSGRELVRITARGRVSDLAFTADGNRLVILSSNDGVWLESHLLHSEDLIRALCGRLTRNLTPDELRRFLNVPLQYQTCPSLPAPEPHGQSKKK